MTIYIPTIFTGKDRTLHILREIWSALAG